MISKVVVKRRMAPIGSLESHRFRTGTVWEGLGDGNLLQEVSLCCHWAQPLLFSPSPPSVLVGGDRNSQLLLRSMLAAFIVLDSNPLEP